MKKPFYLQVERLTVTNYINIIIGIKLTIYNSTSSFLLSPGYQKSDEKLSVELNKIELSENE